MTTMGPGMVGVLELTVHESGEELQPTSITGFLHGAGNTCPKLEEHLDGKPAGTPFDLEIENAYGEPSGIPPQAVPKRELRKQGHVLQPDRPIVVPDSDGRPTTLWITEIRGSRVYLTADHPWAENAKKHLEVFRRVTGA